MLEKYIERALCLHIKSIGGMCEKFTSPGRRSVPDRLITLPDRIVFVEVKATGKRPTELQQRDHAMRRKYGCEVLVIDSMEAIKNAFPR